MRRILFLFAVLAFAISIPISSMGGTRKLPKNYRKGQMQRMLVKQYENFKAGKAVSNWSGEVSIQILTPKGNCFVTSGKKSGIKNTTHFRAASVTKLFTATAILLLYDKGLLDIDDLITDTMPGKSEPYVPDDPKYGIPNKDKITIRLLLEHRAGVFDVTNTNIPDSVPFPYHGRRYEEWACEKYGDDHTFTFDEFVGVVAECQIEAFEPDEKFGYSNTGYSILGKIIERVSEKKYGEFIEDEILVPNGLTQTSFPHEGTIASLPEPYATGYSVDSKGAWTEIHEANFSSSVAEGNCVSTPLDIATFVSRLMGGLILQPSTLEKMMDFKETDENHRYYGLGCNYTYGLGYGHNGGTSGYLTVARYNPDTKVTFVAYCSFTDFSRGMLSLILETDFIYNLGARTNVILRY